jgi:hypothetical protein
MNRFFIFVFFVKDNKKGIICAQAPTYFFFEFVILLSVLCLFLINKLTIFYEKQLFF